ncbi:FixH family protein [Neobacillus soli]|uniref:FixH family protein n=1 Tax=Neobacillus soli TaxID=220688 RepID=UPI000825FA58|nr:FixH family protein [Neobacillus soli]
MKKRMLFVLLLMIAMLAGCSSGPDYTMKVTKEPYYQKDTASGFEIKVLENKKAIKGLKVTAQLSMTNMDHGSYDVKLAEGKGGTYSGKVMLPMGGKYEAVFTLEKDGKKTEKVIDINVVKPKGVAKINGDWITNEDIAFYQLFNKLQLEMNKETAQKKYSGKQLEEELAYLESQEKVSEDKNQLLTQIIRLRSMALLAAEKGHKATDAEVDEAVLKVRDQYNQYDSAKKLISEYGEGQFWATENEQFKLIVLSQKVLKDLITKAQKENPKAGDQEIYYQAQKEYEDLLVSQVNSLKIEIL